MPLAIGNSNNTYMQHMAHMFHIFHRMLCHALSNFSSPNRQQTGNAMRMEWVNVWNVWECVRSYICRILVCSVSHSLSLSNMKGLWKDFNECTEISHLFFVSWLNVANAHRQHLHSKQLCHKHGYFISFSDTLWDALRRRGMAWGVSVGKRVSRWTSWILFEVSGAVHCSRYNCLPGRN